MSAGDASLRSIADKCLCVARCSSPYDALNLPLHLLTDPLSGGSQDEDHDVEMAQAQSHSGPHTPQHGQHGLGLGQPSFLHQQMLHRCVARLASLAVA